MPATLFQTPLNNPVLQSELVQARQQMRQYLAIHVLNLLVDHVLNLVDLGSDSDGSKRLFCQNLTGENRMNVQNLTGQNLKVQNLTGENWLLCVAVSLLKLYPVQRVPAPQGVRHSGSKDWTYSDFLCDVIHDVTSQQTQVLQPLS
nr:MAG TPA: hypothetical protein [Caudoviricetes sp.]